VHRQICYWEMGFLVDKPAGIDELSLARKRFVGCVIRDWEEVSLRCCPITPLSTMVVWGEEIVVVGSVSSLRRGRDQQWFGGVDDLKLLSIHSDGVLWGCRY